MGNRLKKDQIIRFGTGIILSLIVLAVLLRFVDLDQAAEAFANVNLLSVIPLVILLFFAFILRSYSWREILREKNYSPGNAGLQLYFDFLKPLVLWGLLVAYLLGY